MSFIFSDFPEHKSSILISVESEDCMMFALIVGAVNDVVPVNVAADTAVAEIVFATVTFDVLPLRVNTVVSTPPSLILKIISPIN